jgi:hypothetical protein
VNQQIVRFLIIRAQSIAHIRGHAPDWSTLRRSASNRRCLEDISCCITVRRCATALSLTQPGERKLTTCEDEG